MTWQNILIFVGVIVALFIVLKLFKVSFKIIWKILINALIGGVILWLLNYIPGISLPINWITTVATGIFGIPAVIVIFIVSFFI